MKRIAVLFVLPRWVVFSALNVAVICISLFISSCTSSIQEHQIELKSTFPALTITPSLTSSPTFTHIPTHIPTPTPTYEETYKAAEKSYLATQNTDSTVIALFPKNCVSSHSINSISPNGNWMASDCQDQKKFLVISRDGIHKWTITNQQILDLYKDKQYFKYLSVDGFDPYHWSADSRFLYFLVWLQPEPSVGSPALNFAMNTSSQPLYRLDTINGIWNQIVPDANYFSFSPTDRRLVSISAYQILTCKNELCHVEVSLLDMKTGERLVFTINNTLAAGYVVWTEDGNRLFFSAVQKSTTNPLAFNYVIYSIDMQTKSPIKLQDYKDTYDLIYPVNWNPDNILMIEVNEQATGGGVSHKYLDLETNTFILPASTVIP